MVQRFFTPVFFILIGLFSLNAFGTDWSDLQTGQSYSMKYNVRVKKVCLSSDGRKISEQKVIIGPYPGADINVSLVQVVSKDTPTNLWRPKYLVSVKPAGWEAQDDPCRFDLAQSPFPFGNGEDFQFL